MNNPIWRMQNHVADMIRTNATFRRAYEVFWDPKKVVQVRPDGTGVMRKLQRVQAASRELSITYRKSRQDCEATFFRCRESFYSAYRWCHKAGLDMGWADGILEEVRRLSDDLLSWRYWIETPTEPVRVNHRLPLIPSDPEALVYRSPASLACQHVVFENRLYDLTHQLSKLLAAVGDFDRMRFDQSSYTVAVDGKSYPGIPPEAFIYLRAIWLASPRLVNAADIAAQELEGIGGQNISSHVSKALGKLPRELKEVHKSSTHGHWIELPPLPERQ